MSSAPRTQLGASSFSATSEVQAAGLTEFSPIVSVADENIVQVKKDEAMTGDSASALVVVQGTTTGPTFARTYESLSPPAASDVASSESHDRVASYVFTGGARNYLTAGDTQLSFTQAMHFVSSNIQPSVAIDDDVIPDTAMKVERDYSIAGAGEARDNICATDDNIVRTVLRREGDDVYDVTNVDDAYFVNVPLRSDHSVLSERRDTFDLTGMFANVRPDDWQSQFGGHFDVDYPTAGQCAGRRTSPPPTLSTQSTAVPAVQPAQQADRRGTAEAARYAPSSHSPTLTGDPPAARPVTAAAAYTASRATQHGTRHVVSPRRLDSTVTMIDGKQCGPHLPYSARPASHDSYVELDSTVSIRRRTQRTARPRYDTQPLHVTPSHVPEANSLATRHSRRHIPSVNTGHTMVSDRSAAAPVEVVDVVHRTIDALLEVTRQSRDDGVARERLLLQHQQLLQRENAERETLLVSQQKEMLKQQKEMTVVLAKEQKEKELQLAQKQKEKELELAEKQHGKELELAKMQFDREKMLLEVTEKRLADEQARVEADNKVKFELTRQLADERQLRAVRETELQAELQLERQLREWEKEKMASQPLAKVSPSPTSLPTIEYTDIAAQPVLQQSLSAIQPATVSATTAVVSSAQVAEVLPPATKVANTATFVSSCMHDVLNLPSVTNTASVSTVPHVTEPVGSSVLNIDPLSMYPAVPTQPAGTMQPVMKTEAIPEVGMVTTLAQQVPRPPMNTAVATNISWPGQASVPVATQAQPVLATQVTAATANSVAVSNTQVICSPQATVVSTVPACMSTAPTVTVTANPAVVSAVASPAQPVVVVRHYQTPKPYSGQTSHKSFKEHFERVAKANAWHTELEKMQNLALALEGPAVDCLREVKEEETGAYDKLWSILANRFGYLDEPERAMRRFDARKQLDGESVAEYEQALRTLYREAWPKADNVSKDAALKRKFEEGLNSGDMLQFLRLHARQDNFSQTVAKARRFAETQEAVKTKKSVRIIENNPPHDHDATPVTEQSVLKPLLEGFKEIIQAVVHDKNQVPSVDCVTKPPGRPPQQNRASSPAPSRGSNQSSQGNRAARNTNDRDQRFRPPNPGNAASQQSFQRAGNDRPGRGQPFTPPSSRPPGSNFSRDQDRDRGSERSFRSDQTGRYDQRRSSWGSNPTDYRSTGSTWNNRPRPSGQNYVPPRFGQGTQPQNPRPDQNPGSTGNVPPRRACYWCGRVGCYPSLHFQTPRPTPVGCHVCGQVGCHTYFHRQDRGTTAPPQNPPAQRNIPPQQPANSPSGNETRGSWQGDRTPPQTDSRPSSCYAPA